MSGEKKPWSKQMSDPLIIAGHQFGSRLFLGSAGYPNRKIMLDAIAASGSEMVTASIRRISLAGDDESMVDLLAGRVKFLPNTAGCRTAKDAVLTAELAREALDTNWIKLESSATASCSIRTWKNWCAPRRPWWRRVSSCCLTAPKTR
jgi:thiazole synthase ThiGH ThiG subunit